MTTPNRGRARFGILVPFTNTNLEPDMALMCPAGVSMHFARLGGYDADEIPDEDQMAGLGTSDIDDPLALLHGARPDVILYGCTSATLSIGPDFDRDLAARIAAHSGAQTVTAAGALVNALKSKSLGIGQIGFASPYVPEINDRAVAFLASEGIETVSRADVTETLDNEGQGALPPAAVADLARRADSSQAQAIVLSCTDMRSVEAIAEIEAELGKPVVTSNQAMMYQATRLTGIADPMPGYGQLLGGGDDMNQHLNPVARTGADQFAPIAAFVLDPNLTVPPSALRHTATLLIDTLGVAAGATGLQVARIARDHAVDFHAAGCPEMSAPLLFDGRRVSLTGAAWALATQIDNLDGHDGYNPTKGHIGCAVVPALFAFAERHPDLTGPQALTALAMSYEVAARAGQALHATVIDYHTSGAWNALGVAALGCRLEGTNAEVLRHALGIAEYHGPRSQMMREIDNPTMLHDGSGMGALVGTSATFMAMRGFTGAPAITAEAPEVAGFWADLGSNWTVEDNYIKPYPSCRWGHAAIDAVRKLREDHKLTADQIEAVEIRTFDEAARLYAGMPATTTQAQYSLHFAVATMLQYGMLAPSHIEGDGLRDPAVAALVPQITALATKAHNARFPEGRWSDVQITLKDGRVLQSGDVPASGGPGAWRSDADVEAKFHSFTQGVLPPDRARAIWAMRDALLDPGIKLSQLTNLIKSEGNA